MQLTSVIRRAAQTNPKGLATVFQGREQTWPEFVARVAKLAGALQKLGMQDGDRVAILSVNSDRYIEFQFAVMWGGGVIMPMNLRWSAAENAYAAEDSGSTILFVDDAFKDVVSAITEKTDIIKTLVFTGDGDTPDGMLNYEEILAAANPAEDAGRSGEDLAGIFYTGGTTGFPKGVMLPHRGLYINSLSNAQTFSLSEGAISLHAAPMFHIADFALVVATCFVAGTHVVIPSFTPQATLEAIEIHKITNTLLVPAMIQMTVNDPDFDKWDVSSLKYIVYGAAPITGSLLAEAMEKFSSAEFTQAFGQTELCPVATILSAEYHVTEGPNAGKLRSAGRAISVCEIKVVDTDDKELPQGEIGEIAVKGPITMLGYWNKPDLTATALKDGWVYTGDGGYLDEDGFLFIMDRLKDMIVSGGENVYTAEVENAVTQHPAVLACATIGVPSEEWGESVYSIVILQEGATATEDEIKKFCRELIAGYKCPRTVEFRTEPFPLSAANKVLKTELRKPFWEGRERNVN